YAQVEREGLAIIFGVQKFRQYLLGRRFTLRTDQQALTTLFSPCKSTSQLASSRIKRRSLILSAYSYDIQYISTKKNGCADYLSRFPLPGVPTRPEAEGEEVLMSTIENLERVPLRSAQVAAETAKDKVLSRVLKVTQAGWPDTCGEEDLQPYFKKKNELSIMQGCLLWNGRVVIPEAFRPNLLLDLHEDHLGISKMKAIARNYFYWPNMDTAIEAMAGSCAQCREHAPLPRKAEPAMWDWPAGPWRRLHIDYGGSFMGRMFLVVIDAHSKWLEACVVNTATSATTISCLRRIFATHGLPEHIVSDNGTQFTPGHPATNGLAECYVGYLKQQLKKNHQNIPFENKVQQVLFAHRVTPHTMTGEAPCDILMKCRLRTRFSLLQPSVDLQGRTLDHNLRGSQQQR
ncbi:MAG: DDE-type integrase/transposase/recombinase, partial [Kangiellaceae bacterium]|nr:DDE-type integrase/transposase/recombinase [Kangiellaceae bacterium]